VERLPELIARANVGYVGMLCDLMLSNKLMEYVALGVPAVVSRWPTYEHYFRDDAVTYFRPGDVDHLAAAVISVWREPEMARRRAARAARLYQAYRWQVQRQTYLDVYASLLRGTAEPEHLERRLVGRTPSEPGEALTPGAGGRRAGTLA
jgi:glycosyltransferase involved in cell wall biosynthesis